MSKSTTIRVPSKWVLAGEHSVLRGCPAIIFPNPQFAIELEWSGPIAQESNQVHVEPNDVSAMIRALFARVRSIASQSNLSVPGFPSVVHIRSTVPIGAGLGSSAALSVAVVKAVLGEDLDSETIRTVARQIEDQFHGESSGMDIAAVVATGPVIYRRGEAPQEIKTARAFRFSFHDTHLRASTRDCIERVKNHPALAELDQQMVRASERALQGLISGEIDAVAESMTISLEAYRAWGLVPPVVEAQIQDLLHSGSRAVRLTGAGGGGFLVALEG